MKALLDLALFVIDPGEWAADRKGCLDRIAALSLHAPWLRKEPVHLVWSDVFFEGFPWNQPECPPELIDLCNAAHQLHESLRGRGRLLLASGMPPAPAGIVVLTPDLAAGPSPPHLQDEFRTLAASAALTEPAGLSVPTSHRQDAGSTRTMSIAVTPAPGTIGSAHVLLTDEDWRAFLRQFKRPDLTGRKVAVLGGSRAPFERAKKALETYGLAELRRLPPAFEETRTRQETLSRLEKMDLLLVCTNRCKHTDTDHIKGALPCPRTDLNSDSETTLVEAILTFFRDA